MKAMIRSITLAALLLAAACAAQAQDAVTAADVVPPSDLNGNWVLNPELSDNLADRMKPAGSGQRGGGMGGGGRGGGMGGGGRGGGRGGGGGGMGVGNMEGGDGNKEAAMKKLKERGLRLQKEYSRFEIFQEGPELNITNGLDITQLFFTDGRETNVWTDHGELVAQAAIQDGAVRIVTSGRREGVGRTRIFSLSEEGSQLVLVEERTIPGKENPITVRMVYDRAAP